MQRDNLTREEAEARGRLVTDVRSEITFDFTTAEASDTYPCEAVVRFRCTEPGAATFLDLVAPGVESVELNGTPLPASVFDGNRVYLEGLAEENEVRVVATCAYSHSGVGLHRFRDPVDDLLYLFSDFEPFDAHKAFPCFDQPDVKGVHRFTVLAPEGWEAASNMAPASPPSPGRGAGGPALSWTFADTPPISAYIAAVLAGPYHVTRDRHGDRELGLYARRSMARYVEAEEIFEITRQGFEFFETAFDYPYPFGKYDQAFVPEFNSGAMENAGLVTFNESYLFRSKVTDAARQRRAETILHEMAHMWFGDLVTMRWWDDLWLNETFATFMAMLALTRATRFTDGWVTFSDDEKAWAYQQDQLPSTHPIVADVADTDSVHVNFDGITYSKGAAVIRQLVAWVGEEEFLAGVRSYFRRHEWGNTDLGDFLTALEETSGRDLRAWSKEWLETAGVNTLRAAFETEDRGEGPVFSAFRVTQESPAEWPILRPHRLAVGLYSRGPEGLVRTRRAELDVVGAGTEASELVGEALPDLVLVNDEDLAYAKIRLDGHSLKTLGSHLSEIRDPLARAICWSAAWDMVRDAEMRTRDYVDLVLANAEAEADVGVVQRLLAHARSAVDVYGDPANREPAMAMVAARSREILARAEPAGDHQLAWARGYIAAATTGGQLAELRGLLDGTASFDGLAVDTELRWHVVASLASSGAGDEDLIGAELERDPTDAGRRHAAGAGAARPLAQAKAAAWEAVTTDTSLSTAMIGALIRGFQQSGQRELLEPYGDRYFAMLGPVWDRRDIEVALAFGRGMYPFVLIGPETVDLSDRWLSGNDHPWPMRRFVLEGRDGILRAMRARDRDSAP